MLRLLFAGRRGNHQLQKQVAAYPIYRVRSPPFVTSVTLDDVTNPGVQSALMQSRTTPLSIPRNQPDS